MMPQMLTRLFYICRVTVPASLIVLLAACSSLSSGPVDPGFYRVQRGDTLYRIASKHGQRVANLVRWNNLPDANRIEEGQVLRVAPPGAAVASSGKSGSGVTETAGAATTPSSESTPVADLGTGFSLHWPARGPVLARYDGKTNRGIDIGGAAGDPVMAAHEGRIIHVGPLRGYGNLIIVKLNDRYLSAYAHNQRILVREQETVARGQKIAEMGNSDTDQVKLHFEFRRDGKPIDPARFLPSR
jgi:lipoprotein NlpD